MFKVRRKIFVVGIAASKDAEGIVEQLEESADEFIFTQVSGERTFHSPAKLVGLTSKQAFVETDAKKAVVQAIRKAGSGDLVCVTGSLYLCGEARRQWLGDKVALRHHNLRI